MRQKQLQVGAEAGVGKGGMKLLTGATGHLPPEQGNW